MADLVRLAFYPFLPGVKGAIQEYGPDVSDLLTGTLYADLRRRAMARVLRVLGDGVLESPSLRDESAAVNELVTQAMTRMLLVCLGDRIVAGRYAAREAARVRRALRTDASGLEDAIDALEVPVDAGEKPWRIHFSDWLTHAPSRQEMKLVLQTIEDGWITVRRRDAESLVEEAWRRRVEQGLLDEIQAGAPSDLREALQPYLDEIGPELVKAREDWNTGDFGPVRDAAFPPCIVTLFEQMKAGQMVPHHGRFAFASFLGTIGMSADQILDYMTQLPNFSRDKSEYQIRHIAGELGVEPYTPPSCSTMQTNGVCPLERRDDICFSIKHPLSYYRRKLKTIPKPVEDETKAPPAKEAAAAGKSDAAPAGGTGTAPEAAR